MMASKTKLSYLCRVFLFITGRHIISIPVTASTALILEHSYQPTGLLRLLITEQSLQFTLRNRRQETLLCITV